MRSANSSAAVAEEASRTGRPPYRADNASSNSRHRGPVLIQPERRTSATAAMVASSMLGRVKGRNSMRLLVGHAGRRETGFYPWPSAGRGRRYSKRSASIGSSFEALRAG